MFNFSDIVSNVLLEADPVNPGTPPNPGPGTQTPGQAGQPPNPAANAPKPATQTGASDAQNIMGLNGFKELINTYTTQYGKTPDVNEILKAVNIVTGGKYIAAKYTNLGYIPFIDAFAQAYDKITDKDKGKFTQSQIINFIIQDSANFDPIFNTVAANLKNTTNVQEYEPGNPDVNRAWRSLTAETNKLSQIAIQSLGADTIHTAITKIIAKRIPILDRVVGLKGMVRPFNKSVITPVLHQFKRYTGYKQNDIFKNPKGWLKDRTWVKKISGDFSKMVEDISANNLLNVAVLAYEYYMYLLSTQGKPVSVQQSQPVNASLNLFDKFINNILNEEAPPWLQGPTAYQSQEQTPRPAKQRDYKAEYARRKELKAQRNQKSQPQQTQQSGGLPPEQIEKIANEIGNTVNPDYEAFIDGGTSQYLPGVKYDLNTISKDPSREAQALYRALTDMAYFVRKSVGAKERLKYAGQAMGALAGIGGAKLYG